MSYTTEDSANVENYAEELKRIGEEHGEGKYCRTLFIGLGGTGQKSLLHLRYLLLERFGTASLPGMAFLSIDTDDSDQLALMGESIYKERQQFSEMEKILLKAEIKTILDNLQDHKHIEEWLDPALNVGKDFAIADGAGQMRPISRIALFTQMDDIATRIQGQLDSIQGVNVKSDRLLDGKTEVYIVAGLAGGTGSGTFLDIAALVKKLDDEIAVMGYLVMPDCFKDVGKYEKSSANGAAALRELNHFLTNPFHAKWTNTLQTKPEGIRGLFNQVYLHGGTNVKGLTIDTDNRHLPYHNIGEALFLRYSTGSMPGFIKSVRINRVPYMMQQVTMPYEIKDEQGLKTKVGALSWKTALSTFGIAKLVYPSWRLFHYARFDLASKIVDFYNPKANDGVQASVGIWRDRFLIKWGTFQGNHKESEEEYKDFGTNGSSFMVRDALLKLPGDGAENIEDAVKEFTRQLMKRAPVMFEEKKTQKGFDSIESKLKSKFGSPELETGMGDWTAQIRTNKKSYLKQLKNTLNDVIEYFYRKQGLAVVQTILEQIIEVFEKDINTDAKYIAFMENEQIKQKNRIEKYFEDLGRSKQIAAKIDEQWGIFRDQQVYMSAIEEVEKDLRQYWHARYKAFVAQEGAEVLKKIQELVKNKLQAIKAVTEEMERLSSTLQTDRDFFKNPKTSNNIIELPAKLHLDKLLKPFLGTEDPERRLKNYIKTRIEPELGLDTYVGLEGQMLEPNRRVKLLDQLNLLLYKDLKGFEGKTKAFATKDELANEEWLGEPGFLEQYSIERAMLEEGLLPQIISELENVVRNTQPWIKKTTRQGNIPMTPADDVFVSIPDPTSAQGAISKWDDVKKEIGNILSQNAMKNWNFIPSKEKSEIIFYIEQTAFPIFYHQEISREQPNSFLHHYEKLQNDENNPTVLHLFRDYHSYTPLEPFHPAIQAKREKVYESLIKAQMLGIIQTSPQQTNNRKDPLPTDRIGYVHSEPSRGGVNKNLYLHEDQLTSYFLSNDSQHKRLNQQIQEKEEELIVNGGGYQELYALADYWYHIIYPMFNPGNGQKLVQGSVHSKVMMAICKYYKQKTIDSKNGKDIRITNDKQLYDQALDLIGDLSTWTQPNAQEKSYPLLITKPLDQKGGVKPAVEWTYGGKKDLAAMVRNASQNYFDNKWMNQYHQTAEEKPLPSLQINWKVFRPDKYNCTLTLDDGPHNLFAQTSAEIIKTLPQFLGRNDISIAACALLKIQPLDADDKPSGPPVLITEVKDKSESAAFLDFLKKSGWDDTRQQKPPVDIKTYEKPPVDSSKEYWYVTPTVDPIKLSEEDIVLKIKADQDGKHMISDNGQNWKSWKEMDDISSKVLTPPDVPSNPFEDSGPSNPFKDSGPSNPFG